MFFFLFLIQFSWSQYDNGCGVDQAAGDDEDAQDYWYRAVAPCFRANAAYSLYGVLKTTNRDNEQTQQQSSGCNQHTYINSFLTAQGVDSFVQAMKAAGVSFNNNNNMEQQQQQQQENEGQDDKGEDNNNREGGDRRRLEEGDQDNNEQDNGNEQEENEEEDQEITSECVVIEANNKNEDNERAGEQEGIMLNADYTSTSISCSSSGHYVTSYFQGAYCSGSLKMGQDEEPTSALQAFNSGMEQVQCIQIYSASNNNNNNQEEQEQNDKDDKDEESPLSILYTSYACSTEEFPQSCPDPYGKLKRYEHALNRSTGTVHNARRERIRFIVSVVLLSLGLFILIVPLCLARRRKIQKRKAASTGDASFEKATIRKRTLFSRLIHAVNKAKSPRATSPK